MIAREPIAGRSGRNSVEIMQPGERIAMDGKPGTRSLAVVLIVVLCASLLFQIRQSGRIRDCRADLAALRAYVAVQQLDKAETVMDELEKRVATAADAQAASRLTEVYLGLSRELQETLQLLRRQQRTDELVKVSRGFELFLNRIAERKQGNTFASLAWVAGTFADMAGRFDTGGRTLPPEAKNSPSVDNAKHDHRLPGRVPSLISLPVPASKLHSRMKLSPPQEARIPTGENSTFQTHALCAFVEDSCLRVRTSQTYRFPAMSPETSVVPSGDIAIELTHSLWRKVGTLSSSQQARQRYRHSQPRRSIPSAEGRCSLNN